MLRKTEDHSGRQMPAEKRASRIIRTALTATILLATAAGAHEKPTGTSSSLDAQVRAINARFTDVNAAIKEGYAPIPCASGVEGGAMGIHFVNGAYLKDDAVEIGKPEAVMYEPQADGSLQLVAVEYITYKGPATLGGQLFSFTGAPNRYGLDPFYELHVWAWRANPTGTYADMNPDVSCAAVEAQVQPAVFTEPQPPEPYGRDYLPEQVKVGPTATKVRMVNPYGPGWMPATEAAIVVAAQAGGRAS